MFRIDGKTAVVTGGGSGIGEAVATVFASQGAEVYIMDLYDQGGQRVAQAIRQQGGRAEFLKVDVSAQQEVLAAFDNVVRQSGKVSILVNNAGVSSIGPIEQTTEQELDRVYSVNIKGVYNCALAAVRHMKKTGGGVIINMGSIASSIGLPDRFAYSMSKGAVESMTYCIARDYLAHNIRCNSIAPARVHTPFVDDYLAKNYPGREKEVFEALAHTQPIGRMGNPDEIAKLALYLSSDEAAFITGTNYPIDGGFLRINT